MTKDTKEITIPFGAGVGVKDLVIARERAAGWRLEDQKSILILKFVRETPDGSTPPATEEPAEKSEAELLGEYFQHNKPIEFPFVDEIDTPTEPEKHIANQLGLPRSAFHQTPKTSEAPTDDEPFSGISRAWHECRCDCHYPWSKKTHCMPCCTSCSICGSHICGNLEEHIRQTHPDFIQPTDPPDTGEDPESAY